MVTTTKEFRWDLQGLRAVSVLLVILFHINSYRVGAGFFGVDVFFVISGFVITGILLRELGTTGRVDVLQFYARRAKRLLPNASLVLVATLLAAATLNPVYAIRDLAADVIAAALYVANFHFAQIKVDYFSSNRAPSAVMHYWSLSVEEQFYIIWPLIMVAIGAFVVRLKQMRMISIVLMLLWIGSFAFCLVVVRTNQPLAFFHTAARIWELATGALLAVHAPMLAQNFHRFRELGAGVGMVLILATSLLLPETITHPGLITLVPIAGTALVIAAGLDQQTYGTTYVSRLLATGPMVWLGDRSYSLYLWHWPVIIFSKDQFGDNYRAIGVAAVVTLVLAQLAYRYVETPLRRGAWTTGGSLRQLGPAVALIVLVCLAARTSPIVANQLGLPSTKQWVEAVRLANLDDGGIPYRDKCHRGDETDQPECAYAHKESNKTLVLFGDSHAAHWFPAFHKAAMIDGWRLLTWSKSSCPSSDIRLWNPHKRADYSSCDIWRRSLMERLKQAPRPYLVVLSSSNGYGGWTIGPDGTKGISGRAAEDEFERGLRRTVKKLREAGHAVAIMRDTPLADPKYRDCVSRHGDDARCTRSRGKAINPNKVEARVAAAFPGVALINVNDIICGQKICPVVKDGKVIYRDDSHLTNEFVETLYESILELLQKTKITGANTAN